MRYIYAGDRQISVNILKWLIEQGHKPMALFVSEGQNESHADELIETSGLSESFVFRGKAFNTDKCFSLLEKIKPTFIFGIHFPYIIPEKFIELPQIGFLNLHPAFLPYNKGWHTPSWAILEGTPYGATLHFMSNELDKGDIIHQESIEVSPTDTANSLYHKVLELEEKVFKDAFPSLINNTFSRLKQQNDGSSHNKADLMAHQKIELDKMYSGSELITKLRALTTNTSSEAAFFEADGHRYSIQVSISEINK